MGRRQRVDREQLLEICREARAAGVSMHKALEEVFELSHNQAVYYIRQLRAEGLLPLWGGAGEHRYTTATIHRGSALERKWTVCQVCLTAECALEVGPDDTEAGGNP